MPAQFPYPRCPSCGYSFGCSASNLLPGNLAKKGALLPPSSVLHSWKEIASYVGRGVRTVQRWEHDFGLPVHRIADHTRTSVMAFPTEIDVWLHQTPTAVVSATETN